MNELGVFGWALYREDREVREEQVGRIVRTKVEDVDEGGVTAGFSVLDSDSVFNLYTVSAVLSRGTGDRYLDYP